jgi:hypothetical protein
MSKIQAHSPGEIRNGVKAPRLNCLSSRIWIISDQMSAGDIIAPRRYVIRQFIAEGGKKATASTQYGRWRKFNGLKQDRKPQKIKKQAIEYPPLPALTKADLKKPSFLK